MYEDMFDKRLKKYETERAEKIKMYEERMGKNI